jgi:hypothetical protein
MHTGENLSFAHIITKANIDYFHPTLCENANAPHSVVG